MKIYTNTFNKYQAMIQTVSEKGYEDGECIVLSFTTGYAYFRSLAAVGRIKFKFEVYQDEAVCKTLKVDLKKFLHLCSYSDIITLEDGVLACGESTFKWSEMDVTVDEAQFINDNWEPLPIPLDHDSRKMLKQAAAFIDKSPRSSHNGVFIHDNRLVATNDEQYYERKLSFFSKATFSAELLKVLLHFDNDATVTMSRSESSYLISVDNSELNCIVPMNIELNADECLEDPEWDSRTQHESYLLVNKEEFIEKLKFLSIFIDSTVGKAISFEVADKNTLKLKSITDTELAIQTQEIQLSTELLVGAEVTLSYPLVVQIVNSLGSKKDKLRIEIPLKPEEESVRFINFKSPDEARVVLLAFAPIE